MMSGKEKKLLIIALAAIALLIADRYIFSPAFAKRGEIKVQKEQARMQLEKAQNLLHSSKSVSERWQAYLDAGLAPEPQKLESTLLRFVDESSRSCDLMLSFVQPGDSDIEQGFGTLEYTISGAGSMRSVTRFIYEIETAELPVKVDSFQIGASDESGSNITVQINISALFLAPEKEES
ncbi:MAG: hypothetical protein AB7F23_05990 [Phycisphaerae bacterium]|jgi:hypothetical protein